MKTIANNKPDVFENQDLPLASQPSFVGKKWRISGLSLNADAKPNLLSSIPQEVNNDVIVFQSNGRLKGEYERGHEQLFNWTYDSLSNAIELFGDEEFDSITGLKIIDLAEDTLRALTKVYENGLSFPCIITLTAL